MFTYEIIIHFEIVNEAIVVLEKMLMLVNIFINYEFYYIKKVVSEKVGSAKWGWQINQPLRWHPHLVYIKCLLCYHLFICRNLFIIAFCIYMEKVKLELDWLASPMYIGLAPHD